MARPLLFCAAAITIAVGIVRTPVTAYSQQDVRGQDVSRLDLSEPVTYFSAEGSAGSGFREGDRMLAEWALGAWASQAETPVDMVSGPEEIATIRVYWVPAGTGQFGAMQRRMVDGRLAADVFVHPDTDSLGPDIAQMARLDPLFRDSVVYLTCVHEIGHAFGLAHTSSFADIMYSFQYGGDFGAYFMRFREQLEVRDDIVQASPFSAGDRDAFGLIYRSDP